MQNEQNFESFRLSTGGLFYRFLTFVKIQDPEQYNTRRRIIFLVTLCWLPLFLLVTIEGNLFNSSLELPFIYDLKPYVRYLIILPLLIMADSMIDPLIASNLQSIDSSGILGDVNKDKYSKAVEQLTLRKDSSVADIVILVICIATVLILLSNLEDLDVSSDFTNWSMISGAKEPELTYAGWWFLLISSPVLQIILYRWFWRFYLWAEFLFRVSRIKLKLQPTHPDLAGGLGILRNSQNAFILIFLAFGSMLSVSLAEEILYTDFTLTQAGPIIGTYIIASIITMTFPLLFFTEQLVKTKRWGRVVYGGLGYRLSRAFDKKWGNPSDQTTGDELLKTADASAVCDYADIYEVVREMRFIPFSAKDHVLQAFVLIVPFLPLVFTEHSFIEVWKRLFDSLV